MASSIFLNATQSLSFNGTTLSVSVPLLFPDGLVGAPAMAFASEPTLGFWRSSAGNVTLQGTLTATSNMLVGNSNSFSITSNGAFAAGGGAGKVNITDNGANGVGFDVSTDALIKIRTRAQSAYATLDALGFKVSGTAGANFGPSAVASLTIVNGIVTAAS